MRFYFHSRLNMEGVLLFLIRIMNNVFYLYKSDFKILNSSLTQYYRFFFGSWEFDWLGLSCLWFYKPLFYISTCQHHNDTDDTSCSHHSRADGTQTKATTLKINCYKTVKYFFFKLNYIRNIYLCFRFTYFNESFTRLLTML